MEADSRQQASPADWEDDDGKPMMDDDLGDDENGGYGGASPDINFGEDMLRYGSVKDITTLLRSKVMEEMMRKLNEYEQAEAKLKNTITKDDPEYEFVSKVADMMVQIEIEKQKVFKFIRDHYGVRFPELASLAVDGVSYAKLVKLISNDMDCTGIIDELDEMVTSQIAAAIIACACTTTGRVLEPVELAAVHDACDEMLTLEDLKNIFLGYIQPRMLLIAPNLSAFISPGIAAQLFALAGSVTKLATMDSQELAKLGSTKRSFGGFQFRSAGFLINVDLVACHPPELRAKALRLVAQKVADLVRVDDNRRAADRSEGIKAREDVKRKMLQWTDPLIRQRTHNIYERRTKRKRGGGSFPTEDRERQMINRHFRRV
jgi:U4/U6 small nuclear ribonucleoprotein PRP31